MNSLSIIIFTIDLKIQIIIINNHISNARRIKKKKKRTITFHHNLRSILIETPSRHRIEKGVKNGLGREILFEIISISDIAMYDATGLVHTLHYASRHNASLEG